MSKHILQSTSLSSGGVQDNQKGQLYQIKLLLRFMLEAAVKNRKFVLVSEIEEALKFDDLVIDLKGFGIRMLQAKHKKNPANQIKFSSFFKDTDFDLFKYFNSYDIISKNRKFAGLRDAILITNKELSDYSNNLIELSDQTGTQKIYLEKVATDDETFGSFEYRFKLKTADPNKNLETKKTLIAHFRKPSSDLAALEISIDCFMKDFLLITNYSMARLEKRCCEILQSQFNLKNADHIRRQFEITLTEWMAQMKPPNHFLDTKKLEDLYEKIRSVLIKTQRIVGRIDGERRETSGLVFKKIEKELEEFFQNIQGSDQILYVSTVEKETKFMRQKLFQTVHNLPNDTFLFMKTSYSISDFKEYIDAFKINDFFNILAIECDEGFQKYLDFKDQLFDIVGKNSDKKLLVIHESGPLPLEANIKYCSQDKVMLTDLEDATLKTLLGTPVILQGHQIFYKELFDVKDNSVLAKISLREFLETTKIGDLIEFSKPFEHDLYIERTLVHKVEIKPEIIDNIQMKNKITFSESEFEIWCKDSSREDFHLLLREPINNWDKDKFRLYWIKSEGNIQELKNYFCENVAIKSVIYDPKITILIDPAGMGKTTFLYQKTNELKQKFKDHFVVNVCLSNHSKYIENNEFQDEDALINFFAEVLNLKKDIDIQVMKNSLKSGKFIVMLDGADEIAPKYEKKFFDILKLILWSTAVKIFVSSRPELAERIEQATEQLQQKLLPFTKENQMDYLIKYWKKHSKAVDANVLQIFASKLLDVATRLTGSLLGLQWRKTA